MATAKTDGGEEFVFPDEKQKNEVDGKTDVNTEVEIEIEVVDDTPPKDRGRKPLEKEVVEPSEEELEEYSASVKKRIKELTHARHDERRRAESLQRERDELENVARELLAERKTITERYNAGAEQFGKVALEGAQAALDKAKADLRAAHEAFDTDKIIEAQSALASATLRIEQAKSYKPTPMQERKDEVQPRQPQKVEPDQKSLSWQAENQWFGKPGNEDATSYALGLHQKLVNSGTDPRSDEYYEQINARMRSKFPELFDDGDDGDEEAKPQTKSAKKPSTVVAPATRTTAGPGKVRLTQTQLALAKRFGLTPQQYAVQVVKLQKEEANG
jgi:hypothetical protein